MNKKYLSVVILLYLACPFVAGITGYWNPYGPKIYYGEYHVSVYGIGAKIAGRGKPYSVLYERPWFYGGEKVRSKIHPSNRPKLSEL